MTFIFVALGGALGALSRYSLNLLFKLLPVRDFPLGTFLINISGCFLIGLFYGLLLKKWLPETARPFLITGFLGAFTTFSSYILEAAQLSERNMLFNSILYLLISVLCGFLVFSAGNLIADKLAIVLK